jgi:hypothetical protein
LKRIYFRQRSDREKEKIISRKGKKRFSINDFAFFMHNFSSFLFHSYIQHNSAELILGQQKEIMKSKKREDEN